MMTETFFAQYLAAYQPFKQYWNYEDGCVLLGCQRMFEETGRAHYAEFILRYLSERVAADGRILNYAADALSMDSYQCSKLLFFAARLTQEPRYQKAIRWQAERLREHPRAVNGFCWHKKIYPEQLWIDGIYMAAPFFAQYAELYEDTNIFDRLEQLLRFACSHLRDSETGLYYHALDAAKKQPWADPETGLSRSHWLRGEGWFLMALCDICAVLPPEYAAFREFLAQTLQEALQALLPYRAEDGLFYQVIDRADAPGNYTETSGSLMTAYAWMRGAQLHLLDEDAFDIGEEILELVLQNRLKRDTSGFRLEGICSAAGLGGAGNRDGSCAYYLSEPVVSNDPKGVGVLMMAEGIRRSGRSEFAVQAFSALGR